MLNQFTNPTTGGTTPENVYSKLLKLEKVPELQECMLELERAYDSIQAAQVHFVCALHSFAPILGRSLSGQGIDPETAKEAAQTFPAVVAYFYEAFQGLAGMLKNKKQTDRIFRQSSGIWGDVIENEIKCTLLMSQNFLFGLTFYLLIIQCFILSCFISAVSVLCSGGG